MTLYRIVETDNFGGDYPNEKFLNLPPMKLLAAQAISDAINAQLSGNSAPRYWVVRPQDYVLQPGFEP